MADENLGHPIGSHEAKILSHTVKYDHTEWPILVLKNFLQLLLQRLPSIDIQFIFEDKYYICIKYVKTNYRKKVK